MSRMQRGRPVITKLVVYDQTDVNRIRLVLFDEHVLLRASLARMLASVSSFEVVGECGSSAEILEILRGSHVDLVLLDFDPGPDHADHLISAARGIGYQGRFLIVSGAVDAERSAVALKLGASGIFAKSEAPERLVQAIRVVANGALWIDQKIIQVLVDQCINRSRPGDRRSTSPLEDREQRVLLGILGGLTNRRIAERMGVSESSVKNILQSLFSRTGVRKRSQLVRLALEGSLGNVRQIVNWTEKPRRHETLAPKSEESHDATP